MQQSLESYYSNLITSIRGSRTTAGGGPSSRGTDQNAKSMERRGDDVSSAPAQTAIATLANSGLSSGENTANLIELKEQQVEEIVRTAILFSPDQDTREDEDRICKLFLHTAKHEAIRMKLHHIDTKQIQLEGRFRLYLYKSTVVKDILDVAPAETPYKIIDLKTAPNAQALRFQYGSVLHNVPMHISVFVDGSDSHAAFKKSVNDHFTSADRAAIIESRVRMEFFRVRPRKIYSIEFSNEQKKIVKILLRMAEKQQIRKSAQFADATENAFTVVPRKLVEPTRRPKNNVRAPSTPTHDSILTGLIDGVRIGGSASATDSKTRELELNNNTFVFNKLGRDYVATLTWKQAKAIEKRLQKRSF